MKKIFLISVIVLLLVPHISYAGLVPCGSIDDPTTPTDESVPCTFCHIFALIDNVLDFLLIRIVLPVAALMLIVGGFLLLVSPARPEWMNKGKDVLTAVAIGLVVIFAAFIFVGSFLKMIGLADWTKDFYKNWWDKGFFEYPCEINTP